MNAFAQRFTDSQPILTMLNLLSECGRTHFHRDGVWEVCLCAIILALEPQCKLERVLQALPYSTDALDDADILNIMAHLGYTCRKADGALEHIDTRLLPGLFMPATGLPSIVIGRTDDGTLQFYDPVSKVISTVPPSFDLDGKLWFFQHYDAHRQPTSKFMRAGSGHGWFRALLGRFRGTFTQVMTAGLILNLVTLLTPIFIMLVYDRVIAAGSISTLPMLAMGAAIAIVFEWKMRQIRSTGLSWLAGRLDNIVGNTIFAHLIGLPPALIEKASVAAQLARIKTFESVRDFFSGSVFLSLLEAPFVLLAIAAVASLAGSLVWVPLTFAIGYIGLFYYARSKIKISIRIAAKTSSARQQFTIETFEKLEGIRAHGLTDKWQDKFRHLSGREMMAHAQLGWYSMMTESIGHALTVCAAVATIGFGVQMIWDGQLTTGALVATMMLVWRVLTPFYSLCTMVARLEQLRNSIHQVNELLDIDTEAEEARSFSRLTQLKGAISFEHVAFRYHESLDNVFSSLSFDAQAGDLICITGSNGSGKASILKLIQALHPFHLGTIRIDGFDIRQLDAPHLRRHIAYVPKVAHIFSGSVVENLRFANPMASNDDVKKALELAHAWHDTQQLPDGINTMIGTGGVSLTSSLRTRLSLARAYLHPGSIILIDELPNALLSGVTGKNLKDYMVRAKGKRTIICCTYREDFMMLANSIIWLRGTATPIIGTRDEMLPILAERDYAI